MITAPRSRRNKMIQNASPSSPIPEELIKEILLRLPAKSLWKFRCVSRGWLFLISSYDFAKSHLKFSNNNNYEQGRLIVSYGYSSPDLYSCSLRPTGEKTVYTGSIYPDIDMLPDVVGFDNPFRSIPRVVWELGSCNGLVCVVESSKTLILWNPTTGKYREFPFSSRESRFKEDIRGYGFGYDELHDDYKVVEVLNLAAAMSLVEPRVMVYSLRNNCWKAMNWSNEILVIGSGLFLNGAIHWLVPCVWRPPKWAIVSYDLALETFVELPIPVIEDGSVRLEIKVLGGCISLCYENKMLLDVWLLKEYGVVESWTKVVQIPFFADTGGSYYIRPSPLLLMVDGQMLIKYGSYLRLYDPHNPQIHQVPKYEVKATTYFESLVSPYLDDEVIVGRTLSKDVITEILLRLPVKSLLRFKSVSREWLYLISSSDFVKAHLKKSTKNNVHIHEKLIFGSSAIPLDLYTYSIYSLVEGSNLSTPMYPTTDKSLPFDQVRFDCYFAESDDLIRLVGSCNGLVCVSLTPNTIILWNPTTRKSKILPDSGTDLEFDYYSIIWGFGYEELHNDYKVVEFFGADCETTGVYETQIKVYSLQTNSWKIISNWPGGDTFGGTGKFLNGSIHWSVCDLDSTVEWVIVSHDLATDAFVQVSMPNFDGNDDVRVDLKILNGCLAVCCEHNVYMDIWVMKEYGISESWTKLVHIPFFLDFMDHEFVRPSPLFLSMDGKILMNYGSTISIYDASSSAAPQFGTDFAVQATTFSESLVSPNLVDEIIFGLTLPQEIITEILLRSPVKSLMRFKCVSREWMSLISSSNFVMAHLKFSTKNNVYNHDKLIFGSRAFDMDLYSCSMHSVFNGSMLADPIYPVTDEDSPFDLVCCDNLLVDPGDSIWFVGSCNGLVCLSAYDNTIILWNPSTGKSKWIPESGTDLNFDYFGITYAFGYDETQNDYKVVEFFTVVRETGAYETEVKVYSVRSNSWKVLSNWPGRDTFGGPGKFLNGAIHWSVCDFDRAANWVIVSQDLATDSFIELPIPVPLLDDDDFRMTVHVLGGCLAVHCEHNVHMDVWVMKEYGKRESWTKVVRIPFFLDFRDHEFFRPCPLFFSVDGKIVINYGSTIRLYDPSNPESHHFSGTFEVEAITYIESLVSPDLDEQHYP